ncbi:hypothetical protein IT570_14365 [Candidatus Sumerlaeota bacterium]|nr:hypothetical protein [Candidatus Sumerlaeota bacterium]
MFIVALTPLVGLTLPAITPIIFAAAGALGYKAMMDMKEGGDLNEALRQRLKEETRTRVQVDAIILDTITEEIKRAESMYFEKGQVVLAFIKDERGRLRIEASAPDGYNMKQLRDEASTFAQEIAQQFAQSRAVEEIERLNAVVTEEEVTEEGEIRLKVSRWT